MKAASPIKITTDPYLTYLMKFCHVMTWIIARSAG
jgi:hypothetical protein